MAPLLTPHAALRRVDAAIPHRRETACSFRILEADLAKPRRLGFAALRLLVDGPTFDPVRSDVRRSGGGEYVNCVDVWLYSSEVFEGVQRKECNFQWGGRWKCTDFSLLTSHLNNVLFHNPFVGSTLSNQQYT